MDLKMLEMLKKELKEAILKKDIEKIAKISNILGISEEQRKYFEKGLTGYPSIDKVWLQYYSEGADKKANNIPLDKTVWDVIEERLYEHYDVPALEYFGKTFCRKDFIDSCYDWARVFRGIGVEENEIVPIYGPVSPTICAMLFGLNMIGACPYFLKIGINSKTLTEETKESRIAVVFDKLWPMVSEEFSKDKFKNIIITTATSDMPFPKREIVSFISKIKSRKNSSKIPDDKKYIWADKAKQIANYYTGDVKVPFIKDRSTIISSSSGTTSGTIKGVVATNESIISQLYYQAYSDIPYITGDKALNQLPFSVSTSLNSLFMYPLYAGMTVAIDPRVSNEAFYKQIVDIKPNVALTTGCLWESFFDRVEMEMKNGKKFDFSCSKGWAVGGEGTDVKKMKKWNEIMEKAHSFNPLFSGYGLSEVYAGVSVDNPNAKQDPKKPIISVGIPEVGMNVGVFDKDGHELSYNQRGELWVQTQTAMKEYYNKPELTSRTKKDGWIHTNDLAELSDNGLIYVWGRLNDTINIENDKVYFFDIAYRLKMNDFIEDAVVLPIPTKENRNNLVAHIVWSEDVSTSQRQEYIELMNIQMQELLPNGIEVSGYFEYDTKLPVSPTAFKTDKIKMSAQTTGYVQVIDGKMYNIEFILNNDGEYSKKCAIIDNEKVKRK